MPKVGGAYKMPKTAKIWSLTVVFFLIAALNAGCGSGTSKQATGRAAAPPAVKDDSGTLVKLDHYPQRIISLAPSNTEILYALGLGDRVVGVTTYDDYPPEVKKKAKIGDLQGNLEQIVSMKPDLVIAKWTLNQDAVNGLRKLQIPVLCLEPESMDGVYRAISKVAGVNGKTEAGNKLIAGMKAQISGVEKKLAGVSEDKRPRVFIEVGDDPLYTAGGKTFVDELVRLSGGVNIASDVQGYQVYSVESVVQKNPDLILAPDSYYIDVQKVIKKRPGWERLKAVQSNRIINKIDPNLVNRPGPRSAQAVAAIARAFYPDLFK